MITASPLRADAQAAVDVPRWALGFYRRHLVPVVGISLIPAIQRFVTLQWDLPASLSIPLEVLTEGARLVLLILIVRLAISRDETLRHVPGRDRWRRMGAFAVHRWKSLAAQLLLILGAFAVSDILLEQLVTFWTPGHLEETATGILLAVKNPTVIPWFMIWMVGIVRQMMLHALREHATSS